MRYPSIDILRTFAICVMVLVHFGENLSGFHSPITGFGAPLFAFLAGVSYCLWSRAQTVRGKSDVDISRISVRRALFIFGVGFAFNVFVWLPEDIFNWDVLTFIGASLLFLTVTRHLPSQVLTVISIASLLASPVLREIVDYAAYWQNAYFDPDMTLADVIIGFLVTGYFPLLPWIVFPIAGFQAGAILFADSGNSSDSQQSPWLIVTTGMILFAASMFLLGIRPYLPTMLSQKVLGGWTMYPPTTEYVTCTLGLALMLLGLMHLYVDLNPAVASYKDALQVPKAFSRYSFTIYILHHIVHVWPLWVYAMATGLEPADVWMNAMPLTASIPLAVLFLFCTYGLVRVLGTERNYGIEACMRWLCD
jgi:uncharacterized membrane protein